MKQKGICCLLYTSLQKSIWANKYQYNNETFNEWIERVSGGNKKIAKLIRERKFLFAGRILANRGLPKDGIKVTYSNCYVLSLSLIHIFYFPSKKTLLRNGRNREIIKMYNGKNIKDLARSFEISEVQVRNIIRTSGKCIN